MAENNVIDLNDFEVDEDNNLIDKDKSIMGGAHSEVTPEENILDPSKAIPGEDGEEE